MDASQRAHGYEGEEQSCKQHLKCIIDCFFILQRKRKVFRCLGLQGKLEIGRGLKLFIFQSDCRGDFLKSCMLLTGLFYLLFPLFFTLNYYFLFHHLCFIYFNSILLGCCFFHSNVPENRCLLDKKKFDLQYAFSTLTISVEKVTSSVGAPRDICHSSSHNYMNKSGINSWMMSWSL